MARQRRPARYFHILLWSLVLGLTIAAGAVFYKAFQEGTENRTKAAEDTQTYAVWNFSDPKKGRQGWLPSANFTTSFGKDDHGGYLGGVSTSTTIPVSLKYDYDPLKYLPLGTKRVTLLLAVEKDHPVPITATIAPSAPVIVVPTAAPVPREEDTSLLGRIKKKLKLPKSAKTPKKRSNPSVEGVTTDASAQTVTSALTRYCPIPASFQEFSDEQKRLIDPDPFWCMRKPTPTVKTAPAPCPSAPPDWPIPTDGKEIMLYPRPDWCLIATPTPVGVPAKATLAIGYREEAGLTVETKLPLTLDSVPREYSIDLDSSKWMNLRSLHVSVDGIGKDMVVKVYEIRITGKPAPVPTMKVVQPCYWGSPPCQDGYACTTDVQWICPTPTPTTK